MQANHVVIWIDHREAHVLYFDSSKNQIIKSIYEHTHLHHKANTIGSGNAPSDHVFFDQVIASLVNANEILIVGPGSAKGEIVKYIATHHNILSKKIMGVETVDHLTDGQVLAYAKKYFLKVDQLRGV